MCVQRPVAEAGPAEDSDMDEEEALNYYRMMENKVFQKRKRVENPAMYVV